MPIDIFNPTVSVISKDLKGRSLLVYGSNRTAKTLTGINLPKPYYIGFEAGLGNRGNIPFANIQKWSDFLQVVKQLTRPETLEQAQGLYQTIIVDTIEAAARFCEEYTCSKYGVETIASGNRNFGLWKEFSAEIWKPINQLTSVNYTVYFISHEGTRDFKDENGEEYTKIYPRGEKRMIDVCVDLVDIICFVQPNGLDENGVEIKSSAYFTNTRKYLAGTRFDFFPSYIKEFSAEALQDAMRVATEAQERADKLKAVDSSQAKAIGKTASKPFAELISEIKTAVTKLRDLGKMDEYKAIVEKYLGKDASVKDATPSQTQQLELIIDDLKDLMD